ncbi:MAG: DNA repair protein RecN [Clostridia bacterium]|nr:DNA repair protein RecN [Clostridia bacterium]
MLKSVSISNVAVIKELNVDFDKGFTVITGETGAGKSVFIDCISFALGSRADKDMIRTGEKKAEVSALFEVDKLAASSLESCDVHPDENGELLIYRCISDDGKSGAKINGRSVPVSTLRSVSRALMTVHGQQDSGALSEKDELLSMLDSYIGLDTELSDYFVSYNSLCNTKSRLDSLKSALNDKAMMLDILEYQLKEIESAKLSDPDEEDKLISLRNKLRSLEKVTKNVSLVEKALVDNEKGVTAIYMIDRAASAIRQLSDVFPAADDTAARLDEIKSELSGIADAVSDIIDEDDMSDPEKKLDAVEKRLSLIKKLRTKYGDTISDILSKKDEVKTRLLDLKNSDENIEDLENEIEKFSAECAKKGAVISSKRISNAKALTKQITCVLEELDMPKVQFEISVLEKRENGKLSFGPKGYDDIDFLVSANVGEEMQPISKIASGGELSRIMLAIKSSMQKKNREGTSVFDEIDAGVSGGTSERIGRKLKDMSSSVQIICITHSAQIASLADVHLKISKSEISGRVESCVKALDRDGRIDELSRIIGGINITDKQVKAAEEMLDKAANNILLNI